VSDVVGAAWCLHGGMVCRNRCIVPPLWSRVLETHACHTRWDDHSVLWLLWSLSLSLRLSFIFSPVSNQVGLPPGAHGESSPLLTASPHPILATHTGKTGELVVVLEAPDRERVRAQLAPVYASGIRSIAVVLMHAYTFDAHEQIIGAVAREMGFEQVSLSSELMPMVKIVPRGYTACVDAYLTPCIRRYLRTFQSGFDQHLFTNAKVNFMQSDGGLASVQRFFGFRAILSGPAGGVVGYAQTTFDEETKVAVIVVMRC
jgi:hypothetical protein